MTSDKKTRSHTGLVISYFGHSVAVETPEGEVYSCHLKRNQALPVVGDQVSFQFDTSDIGNVVAIMPRHSLLYRGEGRIKKKPIAANIDAVIVVMAPPPIFSEALINRYLIAAELQHIQPVVMMNKIDLLTDRDREPAFARAERYRRVPYSVLYSSIYMEGGLAELANFLARKTAVLVGPSGVGKSSIIAALGSCSPVRVGELSTSGLGKHTTTATTLFHLRGGGNLIDSPGVREFDLWPVTRKELLDCFPEFQAFLHQCKFRDCQHLQEPQCAIKEAVRAGQIETHRYESYKQFAEKST